MLASSEDFKPTISHTRCSVCDTPLVGARFSTFDLFHSLSRVLCLVSRRLWEYPQPDQHTPAHPLVVSSRSLDHPNVGHCHAHLSVAVTFSLRSMLRRVCCVVCIGVICSITLPPCSTRHVSYFMSVCSCAFDSMTQAPAPFGSSPAFRASSGVSSFVTLQAYNPTTSPISGACSRFPVFALSFVCVALRSDWCCARLYYLSCMRSGNGSVSDGGSAV
jgi:hypothetical protein